MGKWFYSLIVIVIIIILLGIGSNLIIQGPINGKVLDAITNKSIAEITVIYTGEITYSVLDPGGYIGYNNKKYITKTNQEGEFIFPAKIFFKRPLIDSFDRIYISVTICKDNLSSCYPNKNFSSRYYWENYIFNKEDPYLEKSLFGNGVRYNQAISKKRITKGIKDIELYLIPLVDNLTECDNAINEFFINECKRTNAQSIATKNNDSEICNLLIGRKKDLCLLEVASKSGNKTICEKMSDTDPAYNLKLCIGAVSTRTKNLTLCNSINGKWQYYGNGYCDTNDYS